MCIYNISQKARIILQDGTVFNGFSFGSTSPVSGEVVFNTGMVGYVETITDPSYAGQILVLTYPLVGNYGVPDCRFFESEKIQVKGLIVSEFCERWSHSQSLKSLSEWFKENGVPGIWGIDTRDLTKVLRDKGSVLGKVSFENSEIDAGFEDPNLTNLVENVSCNKEEIFGKGKIKVIAVDCGMKKSLLNSLIKEDIEVKVVPWDYDFNEEHFDALFLSNGPGDPINCGKTIFNVKKAMNRNVPIFGVCLGNQILALASGAQTYKLKFGHRSQNQPVQKVGTQRCFITSQNHGYAIKEESLPSDWQIFFKNANDQTIEGIKHKHKPWFSVQFHPEASPGPTDTAFLFDEFYDLVRSRK